MHKRTAGLILSGVLATGTAGAVAITPASATTSDNPVASRLAGIKSALNGLVSDGTLTQTQADKVASTLNSKLPKHGMSGPGGHFGWMGMAKTHEAAAKALGMTTDALHTAMQSGKSLAEIAKDKKVSVDSLVKAMVTATESKIATAVKDGAITQEQGNRMKSSLTQKITDRVNRVRHDHGAGHGAGHGPGHGQGHGPRGSMMSPSADDTSGSAPITPANAV